MKNLIDDLVLQSKLDPREFTGWKFIDIYEAAIQFDRTFGCKDEFDKSEVGTNVAPPYNKMIFEFKYPDERLGRVAVFCVAVEAEVLKELQKRGQAIFTNAEAFERENPKWALHFLPVFEQGKNVFKLPILSAIYVRQDGSMIVTEKDEWTSTWKLMDGWPNMYRNIPTADLQASGSSAKETAEWVLDCIIPPVLFSMSLLHCKNVSIDSTAPLIHSKKHKRKLKKRNLPLFEHHIITIRDRQGNVITHRSMLEAASRGRKRLHWTRGHYARYTPEAPAFGRPWGVGTFWIPACLKGTAAAGEVEGSYRVCA